MSTDKNHYCLVVSGLYNRMKRADGWKRIEIMFYVMNLFARAH